MTRPKKQAIAYFNITIQPHNTQLYIDMLKDALAEQNTRKKPFHVHGDRHAILRDVEPATDGPSPMLSGEISRFTELQKGVSWFNLFERRKADEDERDQIQIPEELRPNYKPFRYLFDPVKHLMAVSTFWESESFSPRLIERFLGSLLSQPNLKKKYGEVDITVVPIKDTIERIFEIPQIQTLEILIVKPNPDGLDDEEAEVLANMARENIRKKRIILTEEAGQGIILSYDMKREARVAASNGYVSAEGKDSNSKRMKESTKSHPRIDEGSYNPDTTTSSNAFFSFAKEMIDGIRRRE